MVGRHVMVFGGTSGIGLGIARRFARDGAHVGVVSRSRDKVDAAVAALEADGAASAHGWALDVRAADAVADAAAAFVGETGPIDVLVSAAAGNFLADVDNLSPNGFKAVVDIDLLGTFHVVKAAQDTIRRPGGSIIAISAPQAWLAVPYQAHACAAKAGIDMLVRTLAIEWGPRGVRVNSVAPGPIAGTEGMDRLTTSDAAREAVVGQVPVGRLGTVDDIADACVFLSRASYVSGVVLPVDGGWSTRGIGGMAPG